MTLYFGIGRRISLGNAALIRALGASSRGVGVPSVKVSTVWTRTTRPSLLAVMSTYVPPFVPPAGGNPFFRPPASPICNSVAVVFQCRRNGVIELTGVGASQAPSRVTKIVLYIIARYGRFVLVEGVYRQGQKEN